MESVTYKGIYTIDRQACLPRQGESCPDTSAVFGLHIFMAHQSGPWLTGRTPEDPLVQDSLNNAQCQLLVLLVFYFIENQYQTESIRSETFWRIFLGQKT